MLLSRWNVDLGKNGGLIMNYRVGFEIVDVEISNCK